MVRSIIEILLRNSDKVEEWKVVYYQYRDGDEHII
jgi:hypothetical protein